MFSFSKLTISKTKQFCETSPMFEPNNLKNEAILRDLFIFQSWQHRKRSNSARLPQFLHLTTSKSKQFCETSFKNGKLSAALTAAYQCVLRFFHSTCLKYCACHENWCQVIRSAAPVTQNHLSKPTDLMLQNATPLRKSAPWPPNISHEHVFCTAPTTENASLQILFQCPTPAIVFGNATKPSRFAHFWQGAQSLAPATRNELWRPKSGPNVVCFVHFDLEMCFAPQRRTLFRHLTWKCASRHNGVHFFDIATSKRGPVPGVFCTCSLRNVLRATTACTFSTSQLPKVVRQWFCTFWLRNVLRATTACNFSSLIWPAGSAPAALASLLLDPPEPQIIGKTQCFATFLPFLASASSFFLLVLFYSSFF